MSSPTFSQMFPCHSCSSHRDITSHCTGHTDIRYSETTFSELRAIRDLRTSSNSFPRGSELAGVAFASGTRNRLALAFTSTITSCNFGHLPRRPASPRRDGLLSLFEPSSFPSSFRRVRLGHACEMAERIASSISIPGPAISIKQSDIEGQDRRGSTSVHCVLRE